MRVIIGSIFPTEPSADSFSIDFKEGSEFVSVEEVDGLVQMFVISDTEKELKPMYFRVVRNGEEIKENESFVATFTRRSRWDDSQIPVHLFECK